MAEGVSKLFAKTKAERPGSAASVTDDQKKQAKGFLKRVSKGAGAGGMVVAPPESSDSAASAGAAGSSRVMATENPSVVVPDPEAQETGAEELFDGDDPLALVVGESDEGLLGEKLAAGEASVYQSSEPHPLRLFEQLSADFDRLEWTLWEPEAQWDAIEHISGVAPSDVVKDTIGALGTLVESEAFWNEHHIFLWTAQALNGQITDFARLPDLTPAEVTFAIGVAAAVRDADDIELPDGSTIPGVTFDDQVLATIAVVFHTHGLVFAPPPLDGVNEHLAKFHDAYARGLAAEVKAEWGKMGDGVPVDLDETPLALQIARLIDIREYVRDPYA